MIAGLSLDAVARGEQLSAAESDPRAMGWMQGTSPAPDKQVTVAAGDFFGFPKSRWTVHHIRDLFATVEVSRGVGPATPLAETLIAEGRRNAKAPATDYVPELADTDFADTTVRQVMAMTTGIKFDGNYDDPNADIWIYSAAGSPLPKPPGCASPVGYRAYVEMVEPEGKHGPELHYKTVNTDVLAYIVTRTEGCPTRTRCRKCCAPVSARSKETVADYLSGRRCVVAISPRDSVAPRSEPPLSRGA